MQPRDLNGEHQVTFYFIYFGGAKKRNEMNLCLSKARYFLLLRYKLRQCKWFTLEENLKKEAFDYNHGDQNFPS